MAQSQAQSVVLPRVVDLDALDEIRETLLGALQAGPVDVDAQAVDRVSTNALFMLLSAAETAKQVNFAFAITTASEVMRASIEKLGLTEHFAPVLKG